MPPTDTKDGQTGQAGKAPAREHDRSGLDKSEKRTSAQLLDLWGETKAAYSVVPKRPSAKCNLTIQSSLRRKDVLEALQFDRNEAAKWDAMVKSRLFSLVGDGEGGAADAGSYAARLDAFKGVTLRIGQRLYDGVALASALRNERADILGGKASDEA